MTTEQTAKHKESATVTLRNNSDYEIFKKLLKIQGQDNNKFVTAAVYHYIHDLLDNPDELLRNSEIKKLEGLTFGDIEEDNSELPIPGELRREFKNNSFSGSTYQHTDMFVGVFEGKSAHMLDEHESFQEFSFEPATHKGKRVWTFWIKP